MTIKTHKAALYLMLPLLIAACGPTIEQIDMTGETMGTTYTIKVIGESINESELKQQIEAVFERINAQMSTWRPDSEISLFNLVESNDWFEVSSEFLLVLDAAQKINQQTEGAFDITVSGLVTLWGFGPSKRQNKVPDAEAITDKLNHIGPATFEIDLTRNAIRKIDPEVRLDLSGIAKGYAVDAVVEFLKQEGINRLLVEVGGEVRASGGRLDGSPWRVAIVKPDPQRRSIQTTVGLDNTALATSGDYRDNFQIGDKRYSHIIDPRTGRPPNNGVASVSVIAGNTMTADALATGFMVMGTERAMALAVKNNLAVMIIEREEGEFRIFSSDSFEALQSAQPN